MSFKVESIGKLAGLAPEKPLSVSTSKAYFLWQRTIPLADLATSMPRKYFNSPKSFTRMDARRNYFIVVISARALEAMITSSTYINNAIKLVEVRLMKS